MTKLIKRMDNIRDCSIEDAISWCHERELDPASVTITACHVKFETPETDAESERREQWQQEHAERVEAGERRMLARLREKYPDA